MAEEPNEPASDVPVPAQLIPARPHKPELTDLTRLFFGPRAVSSIALTGLFVLGLIAFFYFAKAFLMPVILALLLSFLLRPAVNAFCRRGVPRGLGAAIVLVLFIGLISTSVYRLNKPATDWLSKAPESLRRLESKGREFVNRVDAFVRRARGVEENRPERFETNGTKTDSTRLAWAEKLVSVGAILGFTAGFLAGSLETLVLLYFLLASGDLFLQKLVRLLPKMHEKKEAVEIAREVEQNISGFLFTITIINCCVALVVALVMLLLGMPNPVLWGVVAGLLNFIPYVGPLTVVLVLVLAGFLSFESTFRALLPSMIYLGIHMFESNILTPTVLGRRLTLSPVIIFVSLMFWTWLWGMPGALLAIPLLMTFKIFCDHFKPLAPIAEFLSG
jgi:predicted PurR-regulated permease PerM